MTKDYHYGDVIMGAIASQIISLTIVYSTVYSDADQRKHQSSASLAFVWGIHRSHKWPVTRKMFPFDDVIMIIETVRRLKDKIENNSMSTLATNKIFREDLTVQSVGGHDILRVVSSTSLCNLVILTEYNARASETNLSIFCEIFIDEFHSGLYILFQHQVCNGIYTSFIDMHPFQVYMYMYPSGCNGLKVDNHDFVYGGGVDILTHNE